MVRIEAETANGASKKTGSVNLVQCLPGRPALETRRGSSIAENKIGGRQSVADNQMISRLFQGYFNNKITLLLFLIQSRSLKPNPKLVESVSTFLNDLYRHMLTGEAQKKYRCVFKWLTLFFQKLPHVSLGQRDKAIGFIRLIYDAVGLHLKIEI